MKGKPIVLLVGALLAVVYLSEGCASTTKEPGLPPKIATHTEKVTLQEIVRYNQSETKEFAPFLISAAGEIAKVGLKWLASKGGELLKAHAAKFGSTYSSKVIQADYRSAGAAGSYQYYFLFRRSIAYNDEKAATDDFGDLGNLAPHSYRVLSDGHFEVDAVSVPIVLMTTPDNRSWRFVPFSGVPKAEGTLTASWSDTNQTNWNYATNIIFQARKGDVLEKPWGKSDNFKVAISATIRFAENDSGIIVARRNDPTETMLTIKNGKLALSKPWLVSDWQPAPSGPGYSLEVIVVESSKMEEWIKKTADSLVKASGGAIDKGVDSEVKTNTPK